MCVVTLSFSESRENPIENGGKTTRLGKGENNVKCVMLNLWGTVCLKKERVFVVAINCFPSTLEGNIASKWLSFGP